MTGSDMSQGEAQLPQFAKFPSRAVERMFKRMRARYVFLYDSIFHLARIRRTGTVTPAAISRLVAVEVAFAATWSPC